MVIFEETFPASAGTIKVELAGDIGGNSQKTIITLKEGQWPETKMEVLEDEYGVKLEVCGTWEIEELVSALTSAFDSKNPKLPKD